MLQPRRCMSLSLCRFVIKLLSLSKHWLSGSHLIWLFDLRKFSWNWLVNTKFVSVFWASFFKSELTIYFRCELFRKSYLFFIRRRKLNMCTAVFFVKYTSRLFIDQINRFICDCFICSSLLESMSCCANF